MEGQQLPYEPVRLTMGMYGDCAFFTIRDPSKPSWKTWALQNYDFVPVRMTPLTIRDAVPNW